MQFSHDFSYTLYYLRPRKIELPDDGLEYSFRKDVFLGEAKFKKISEHCLTRPEVAPRIHVLVI